MKNIGAQKGSWEDDLKVFVSQQKVDDLKHFLSERAMKVRCRKKVIIILAVLIISILIYSFQLENIVHKDADTRMALINGLIAFLLAFVTFISPINTIKVERDEIESIIGMKITNDIIKKIEKEVLRERFSTEKLLALIGAMGIIAEIIIVKLMG
jgi:hypothetical protein